MHIILLLILYYLDLLKLYFTFCNISRDDHQFSPLHWAAKGGHTKIVEMLMSRGARVHTTNMGDDTPLHLAAAFGNRDILLMVGLNCLVNAFNTIELVKIYMYTLNM